MKKPTKPPPPPPPPPRSRSPAHTCYSFPCHTGGGSEYAESVCSAPISTRSLQPQFRSQSPHYFSCRSESAYSGVNLNLCCQGSSCCISQCSYSTCSQSVHCGASTPICGTYAHRHHVCHTPPPRVHYELATKPLPPPPSTMYQPSAAEFKKRSNGHLNNCSSNNSSPLNNNNCHAPHELQQVNTVPPTPRERATKQRIVISSPLPKLKFPKKEPQNYRGTRPLGQWKARNYQLHIEQHIERLFKYLRKREERRQECLDLLKTNQLRSQRATILTVSEKKESLHLRKLRARITADDFRVLRVLGTGFFGQVSLVRYNYADNKPLAPVSHGNTNLYAMKKLKKSQVIEGNYMARVMAERDILAEADNEWIVKLFCSFQDNQHLYFILEFIQGGDMMNLLLTYDTFPERWAKFYTAEISLALQFVHDMGFIHRDIKPDNILIDVKGHIKLTDFGLCTGFRWTHDTSYYTDDIPNEQNAIGDHPTITKALIKREIEHSSRKKSLSLVGSPDYIAPEVLRRENSDERLCDWWSVGVILYEMVVGRCPFIDMDEIQRGIRNPATTQKRILDWKNCLAFPKETENKYIIRDYTKDLISKLLCDPADRICQNGISDIQDHKFFEGIDWINIRSSEAPYIPSLENDLDTRHFDQNMAASELTIDGDGSLVSGISRMRITDFTYRCFQS